MWDASDERDIVHKLFRTYPFDKAQGKTHRLWTMMRSATIISNELSETAINSNMEHLRNFINIVESADQLQVPDDIRLDLIRFTEFAGKTLKPATVAWLKSHPELRGASFPLVVYRGVTIEKDDFKGHSPVRYDDIHPLEPITQSWFGIGVAHLKVGSSVMLRRRKPTSWSKSEAVASSFLHPRSYWSQCYGWVLIRSELSAEQVLLDFQCVPNLSPHNADQDEVISVGAAISGEVMSCCLREHDPARMPGRRWGGLKQPDHL